MANKKSLIIWYESVCVTRVIRFPQLLPGWAKELAFNTSRAKKIYPFLNMRSCLSAGAPKSFVISRYDQHLMCLDAELHICL